MFARARRKNPSLGNCRKIFLQGLSDTPFYLVDALGALLAHGRKFYGGGA